MRWHEKAQKQNTLYDSCLVIYLIDFESCLGACLLVERPVQLFLGVACFQIRCVSCDIRSLHLNAIIVEVRSLLERVQAQVRTNEGSDTSGSGLRGGCFQQELLAGTICEHLTPDARLGQRRATGHNGCPWFRMARCREGRQMSMRYAVRTIEVGRRTNEREKDANSERNRLHTRTKHLDRRSPLGDPRNRARGVLNPTRCTLTAQERQHGQSVVRGPKLRKLGVNLGIVQSEDPTEELIDRSPIAQSAAQQHLLLSDAVTPQTSWHLGRAHDVQRKHHAQRSTRADRHCNAT